ncbi:hypothetical protein Aazo_1673 ['Nostoc azollae' 0708]|jgi:hypothetical protein|uniref:Uncharacterized protein n=1 Tax=Nostoc azollae (strain 0708) TaxID=551115 RepID=D7E538_NOSA0|nr:hypothetical protein Aazo_1673 ['Nostoc azollae' 0708]
MKAKRKIQIRIFFMQTVTNKCMTVKLTRVPCIGETIMFDSNSFPEGIGIKGTIFKVVRVNHWVDVDDDGIVGDVEVTLQR